MENFRLLIFAVLFFTLSTSLFCENQNKQRYILLIHSYSIDYQWTQEIDNSIRTTLNSGDPSLLIRTEFMDTKNLHSDDYLLQLVSLYKQKYSREKPAGIILTDNNALDFYAEYGKKLFPGIPAVACGINFASPGEQNSFIECIIAENANHNSTLDMALSFFPETRDIYVVSGVSTTGRVLSEEVQQLNYDQDKNVNLHFLDNLSLDELMEFASQRSPGELFYILPYFRSPDGIVFTQRQVEALLASHSPVPVLVSWKYQMDSGVLGGVVISSFTQGRLAAEMLIHLLKGEDIPSFLDPVKFKENEGQPTLDYSVSQHFGLIKRNLGKDIEWINREVPFLQRYRKVLIPLFAITIGLLIVIVLLHQNLLKQRTINQYNHQVLNLNREIIETQQELVMTLGEVIEVRSKDTGNHVNRVSKISRFIAEKYGFDSHELDIIEASTSLHDVGKIGIPEKILYKPGKLTPEEFDIVKQHTVIGHEILDGSNRELLKTARDIAQQHHERWDGSGYPHGLAGENICIHARITMITDVFDALLYKRCYKQAWPLDKVLEYIRDEKGKSFDPHLVDLFLFHIEDIYSISQEFKDSE